MKILLLVPIFVMSSLPAFADDCRVKAAQALSNDATFLQAFCNSGEPAKSEDLIPMDGGRLPTYTSKSYACEGDQIAFIVSAEDVGCTKFVVSIKE